jgi:hypothetical protein
LSVQEYPAKSVGKQGEEYLIMVQIKVRGILYQEFCKIGKSRPCKLLVGEQPEKVDDADGYISGDDVRIPPVHTFLAARKRHFTHWQL